jgi:hypothetical protein
VAARLRKTHQDDVRTKIQVSQLLNVLQNHALGKLEELSPTRLRSIEILLKKTLPDLSQIEASGPGGGPIVVEVVKFGESQ